MTVRSEWVFLKYQAGWHRRNLSPVPAKSFAEAGVFILLFLRRIFYDSDKTMAA
ncbi:MAG: hypothetical protein PUK72_05545 [Oscillospiraceae bacterium]|nr:hypothetical protein [Oscillospiraceae bacterium]MDD7470541.1 hypothetical protein [Oscillospiraceae bacterium]MDO4398628.1 hypothetical protein [Oscillospiraceae bacterium]MDY2678610.1 hypothetical protein [Oscillospiraceae bacterium]